MLVLTFHKVNSAWQGSMDLANHEEHMIAQYKWNILEVYRWIMQLRTDEATQAKQSQQNLGSYFIVYTFRILHFRSTTWLVSDIECWTIWPHHRIKLWCRNQGINTRVPMGCDDVIRWKHFPRYWPFVRGIHRSPVKSPHKGQWRWALMFSLICAWIDSWVNSCEAGESRRHRVHYDVTVM